MKRLFILLFTLISLSGYAQHLNGTDIRLINGSSGLAGTTNGTVYFDTGLGKFQFRQGGSWLDLGGGAVTGSLTSGYVPKATGTTTLSNSLIYDDGTKIGIGTTSPTTKLSLIGGNFTIDNSATSSTSSAAFKSSVGNWEIGTDASGNGTSNNQFYIYDTSFPAYRLTVQKTSGNVGINTAAPTQKLHVVGGILSSDLTTGRVTMASTGGLLVDDSDLTFSGSTLTATNATVTTGLINSALTSGRVIMAGTSGLLQDDSDLTFTGGNTLNATNATVTTSLINSALTSGRVTMAGTSGVLQDDADLTFSGSTLAATNIDLGTAGISGNRTMTVKSSTTDANLSLVGTQGNGVFSLLGADIDITATNFVDITSSPLRVANLTSGRVTTIGTSGRLQDDADLTFDGTSLSIGAATPINLGAATLYGSAAVSITVKGGDGSSGIPTGANLSLQGGPGYTTSGNNAGGDVEIFGGTPRATAKNGNVIIDCSRTTGGGALTGYLILQHIPTSSAGLPSGAVWSNLGVLSIVP